MTQMIITLEDNALIADIKKALKLIRGVASVRVATIGDGNTITPAMRLSSYERSLRDLDEGRVYEYDSLNDLIKEIEG